MAEPAFDTMAAVRRLRDSGLEERQAEAITETVREGITGGVATKADFSSSNAGLRDNLSKMEAGFRDELSKMGAALRNDMSRMGAALRKDMSRMGAALRIDMSRMGAALRIDMSRMEAALRKDMSRLEVAVSSLEAEFRTRSRIRVRWIKIIGGAILAVLIFPWLAEFLSITMPGTAG